MSGAFDPGAVRRSYQRVAWFYDSWARVTESKAHARVLRLARPEGRARVLEVAVGTGRLFRAIAAVNSEGVNVGVDLSWEMLARARARPAPHGRRPLLAIASAYALPIRGETVDVLANTYMLDLLPAEDFPAILAEFRRVLRPGGRLVVTTMAFGDRWYHRLWAWLARRAPSLLTGCRPVRIAPALTAAGFVRVGVETISQNTFPSEVLVAERPVR